MGILASGGVGWLLGTTPLTLAAQTLAWKWSFFIVGIISLILVVANLKIVADTPSKRGLPEIVEQWDKGRRVEPQGLKSLTLILKEAHFSAIAIWFMMRGDALFFLASGQGHILWILTISLLTKQEI